MAQSLVFPKDLVRVANISTDNEHLLMIKQLITTEHYIRIILLGEKHDDSAHISQVITKLRRHTDLKDHIELLVEYPSKDCDTTGFKVENSSLSISFQKHKDIAIGIDNRFCEDYQDPYIFRTLIPHIEKGNIDIKSDFRWDNVDHLNQILCPLTYHAIDAFDEHMTKKAQHIFSSFRDFELHKDNKQKRDNTVSYIIQYTATYVMDMNIIGYLGDRIYKGDSLSHIIIHVGASHVPSLVTLLKQFNLANDIIQTNKTITVKTKTRRKITHPPVHV